MSSDPTEIAPFLFELSGEHASLPAAEVMACVEAECPDYRLTLQGPGYLIVEADTIGVEKVATRLALTHRLGRVVGNMDERGGLHFAEEIIEEGSVAVRIKRYQMYGSGIDVMDLTKKVGSIITEGREVDLDHPDKEIRGFMSDRTFFYLKTHEIDRGQFDRRAVKERPFFSPISLHPRLARALVNLTSVRKGESLLDPFCGTGGILIEAALLGVNAMGSDLSPKMIEGCAENMDHFGLDPDRLEVLDIGDVPSTFGEVDAIVTDPPYGRSASTNKEALNSLYGRSMGIFHKTLRPGHRLGIAYPREVVSVPGLDLLQTHVQRVHRSLDRRYCVYRRST
jgi:tRNA (guanine10-N2)-dimethyltransferase